MVGVSDHCAWHQGRVRWWVLVIIVHGIRGGLGGGC